MISVYIGLGSNLDDPIKQLVQALTTLSAHRSLRLIRQTSFYRSKPMGKVSQADFINAVVELETDLPAHDLLGVLQEIEKSQHRVRTVRWGPRTLDMDILLYGDETIDSPLLKIPHPGLKVREFVIFPLAEIAPNLVLPSGESILELMSNCPRNGLEILS